MGPAAGMMGPAGMQPQAAPGMCGPGPTGPMGPHAHPQGPGVPGQPHMHNDPFYCSPFGSHYFRSLPVPRRHTPYFGQPDYRLYELNKRLQQRTEESDNLWWDAFATEFFEDDATLTLTFCLEDGPKRYTIGRTLIPRYFRSIFEGGVTELYYNLKHPKESFHNTSITLDCDNCVMVTHHGKPMFTKVCTEGRLILEFTFDDLMRIKSWHMSVRTHKELVPRTVVGMQQDPTMLEQLSKNITRQGITNSTLNYLRLCVILEPMQELMSRHKAYALSPRDCLKTTLFQKWQRMVAPPGKRGRRTVALHEKHQPVEPNGRPVYRRIRFSIARRRNIPRRLVAAFTGLGSNRFLRPELLFPLPRGPPIISSFISSAPTTRWEIVFHRNIWGYRFVRLVKYLIVSLLCV
ncbi:LIM domain-binding protein 2 isoform X3 [Apis dorsata]|uniref:LIM domain-binding protein 2 isoform X3 n=1 Tax=Apis dorsata TaxID=7462 RepID=UPI0012941654|nr:LIM domain-binding protein 2 isoform X3 [Apis dorsata]